MNFSNFLATIFNSFNTFFSHIINYIESIMQNNFIKLIIYLVLFGYVINFLFNVIKLLLKILTNSFNNNEIKKKENKKNIE